MTEKNGSIPVSKLTKNQKQKITRIVGDEKAEITLRFDDECGNGRNMFAITANLKKLIHGDIWRDNGYGCCHEDIARLAPDLEKYIKWHGTFTDAPTHYIENTMYHASDKDCWGKRKGEPYNFRKELKFNDSPIHYKPSKALMKFIEDVGIDAPYDDFELIEVFHVKEPETFSSKWTFGNMPECRWYECPFDTFEEACRFVHGMTKCKVEIISVAQSYGKGKEPDLEAARVAAIWPDATLEELQSEAALMGRLPYLMDNFKAAMEELGFEY